MPKGGQPGPRRRLDPDELMALRRGDDQDGRQRTWTQVGAFYDVTGDHARRTATRSRKPITVKQVDPREFIPELKTVMSDADVARWLAKPYCVCGCGLAVRQATSHKAKMPIGAWQPFRGNHEKRMPWWRSRMAELNASQMRRLNISRAHKAASVETGIITDLIAEWMAAHGKGMKEFAEFSGLSYGHVCDIMSGRYRILPFTAARILHALGEPIRPEIRASYEKWKGRQRQSRKPIKRIARSTPGSERTTS
jgi:hypothetical protein